MTKDKERDVREQAALLFPQGREHCALELCEIFAYVGFKIDKGNDSLSAVTNHLAKLLMKRSAIFPSDSDDKAALFSDLVRLILVEDLLEEEFTEEQLYESLKLLSRQLVAISKLPKDAIW